MSEQCLMQAQHRPGGPAALPLYPRTIIAREHGQALRGRDCPFDEPFRRLWEYYLCYCEAGFRAEKIDVRQLVFARRT